MLHRNLMGGVKIRNQLLHESWLSEYHYIIATRCHMLRLKMRHIRFLASVRLFVCPFVSYGVWHLLLISKVKSFPSHLAHSTTRDLQFCGPQTDTSWSCKCVSRCACLLPSICCTTDQLHYHNAMPAEWAIDVYYYSCYYGWCFFLKWDSNIYSNKNCCQLVVVTALVTSTKLTYVEPG